MFKFFKEYLDHLGSPKDQKNETIALLVIQSMSFSLTLVIIVIILLAL